MEGAVSSLKIERFHGPVVVSYRMDHSLRSCRSRGGLPRSGGAGAPWPLPLTPAAALSYLVAKVGTLAGYVTRARASFVGHRKTESTPFTPRRGPELHLIQGHLRWPSVEANSRERPDNVVGLRHSIPRITTANAQRGGSSGV